LENKTFFDISNGVRKKFSKPKLEDIGEKKGFQHVLTKICEGKFFLNLNSEGGGASTKRDHTIPSVVRKIFFDSFF
jgi:hypothetical protein